MTDRKLRVFLCHSSQDKPIVRELYQRLNSEGWIDPWLDEEKLLPGQDWDMEIEKAVEVADAVIVCLSKSSLTKEGYVQKELRFVLDISDEKPDETVFVIPIRLDDCIIPRRLKRWQYVDYFPISHRDLSYGQLLQSLGVRKKKFEEQQTITSDTLFTESDRMESERKEKMRIQRDYYEKGYSEHSTNEADLSNEIQDLLAWAQMERKHKDYIVARQLYQKASAMLPNNISILRDWADMESESGDFLRARLLHQKINSLGRRK